LKPKFIADEMLGKLARWLRLLGYDTEYGGDDSEIISRGLNDDRIILSRDKELIRRASSIGARALLVSNEKIEGQLAQLLSENLIDIESGESRCPMCNGEVKYSNGIWVCIKCGKKYWIGRHWKSIREVLRRVRSIARPRDGRNFSQAG